jgi:hypothetical protein
MADIKQKLYNADTPTITIASLANDGGRASAAIDNSTDLAFAADIRLKIKTGASGVLATGYIAVYLIRSEDGTNYDDGFAGSDAAYTPVNAILLGIITANANATTYNKVFDTAELGITLPSKFAIGIVNKTGAALDSTAGNHGLSVRRKYAQAA